MKKKHGFTLAEMLIVVAIIAVLVAIVTPVLTKNLEKSREATDMANIRSAYSMLQAAAINETYEGVINIESTTNISDLIGKVYKVGKSGDSNVAADGFITAVTIVQKTEGWATFNEGPLKFGDFSWDGKGFSDDAKVFYIAINAEGSITGTGFSFSGKTVDCLAAGTKITMADGSIKNIEDIVIGDEVLTYNHEKGTFEANKIYLAWKCEEPKCAFTLHFEGDVNISVVGDHDFFEQESLKYVAIFEDNAEEFIGMHYYNVETGNFVELLSVTYETEPTEYYEIYTEFAGNCIAENMLNTPYDNEEALNIFEFNEDLTINKDALQADIEEFGLFEFEENGGYSKEVYDALGWKYANIMVGKGFGTMDEFFARRDAFLEMINE